MKLYSYVVEHDYGHAPNPYFGVCTLARCKFRKKRSLPRNLVEMACIGDWVVGTGGKNLKKSAGNGNLIYAMKIEEKLTLGQYWADPRFKRKKHLRGGNYAQQRGDNRKPKSTIEEDKRFVLLSWEEYYYFGKKPGERAVEIPKEFRKIEKKGPKYKVIVDHQFIGQFLHWLKSKHKPGIMRGQPWGKEYKSSKELRKREACRPSC